MKIQHKLTVSHSALVIVTVLALGLVLGAVVKRQAIDSLKTTSVEELEKQIANQLTSIRDIQRTRVEAFFQRAVDAVEMAAARNVVSTALGELQRYHDELRTTGSKRLDIDSAEYNKIWRRHDRLLKDYIRRLGYRDVAIVDDDGGHVLYTHAREIDLGTNLRSGALKNSALARLWHQVIEQDRTAFVDFEPYAPSNDEPAAFIGTPIRDGNNESVGVLIFQLSIEAVNEITHDRTNMGKTGETYLVGLDHRMRSDSFLDPRSFSAAASFKRNNLARSDMIDRALEGETGTAVGRDYRLNTAEGESNLVLSSYAPVDFLGVRWALLCERDVSEAQALASVIDAKAKTIAFQINAVSAAFMGLFVIAGFVTAFFIARGITKPILRTVEVADAIASGDLDRRLGMQSADEVGRLANALDEMADSLAKNVWLKTGATELADRTRGEKDILSLSRSVVTFLAEYLGAQMATLFLVDETGESLNLTASYAFNRRRSLNERIRVGEGLAGQAALEQSIISVTDVPEDYVRISSTLGESPPCNILAAPLAHDGKLTGVVELASFKEYSDIEMTFLTDALGGAAIAFNSARSRQKRRELLEETQRQAEELEEKNDLLERQQKKIEHARQDIEEKARELELASKYKSEFLANMSHELRTPLNSLLILAKMPAGNDEGNLTKEQVESAEVILRAGQELLFLINEILDLSKVEAGMMEVHHEEVKLDADCRQHTAAIPAGR